MNQPTPKARDFLALTPQQELAAARVALRMLGAAYNQPPAILLEAVAYVLATILERGEPHATDFQEAAAVWDVVVCRWCRDRALEVRLEILTQEAEAGDRVGTA